MYNIATFGLFGLLIIADYQKRHAKVQKEVTWQVGEALGLEKNK